MLAGVLCFSSSSTLVKWSHTTGGAIAFWRLLISAVLWWVIIAARRLRTGEGPPAIGVWKAMIPVALCFGLNLTVFFTAIQHTSIAHAEFITALSPLVLVPAGALLFGERPDVRALAWGLVTLVGLAIVLFTGGSTGGATLGGDLMVGVVVALWAGYLITARRARVTIGLVDFMAALMNLAFVIAIPATVALAGADLWSMPWRGWVVAALLAGMTGVIAHGLIAYAQRGVEVGTISILQVGQPALAVGWAYLILGEAIAPSQVPGMALVLLGLAAFTIVSQRRAAARR